MKAALAVLLTALSAAPSAGADAYVSAHPDAVSVTFYHDSAVATSTILHPDQNPWVRNSGFAFITETRAVDIPAGDAELKFEGVASTMVPQTARIEGLPDGVREQNFDYDLLSPGSLLAKSIGETVQLVRTDPKTGKSTEESAVIRSGPSGVVLEIAGKFEALRCSGLPERLVFARVPGTLTDTPTLGVRTHASQPGHYAIKLSYIATGLNWSADYVARVAPDGKTLDLSGWLTLANFSQTSFARAPVDVVAGHLQTTGEDKPIEVRAAGFDAQCWPTEIDWATHHYPEQPPPPPPAPAMGAPMVAQDAMREMTVVTARRRVEAQELGDYKLYPLPEPTTVAAQQTKQIQFLDQTDVPFERIYSYTLDPSQGTDNFDTHAHVILRLQNRAESGLGKPLPAGSLSVFESAPAGDLAFAGQNAVRDMAVGLPVEVETGRAMDLRIEPRLASSQTIGSGKNEKVQESWEIALENDKRAPVTLEFRQGLYGSSADIISESQAHVTQSGRAVWTLSLPAAARAMLRYTVIHPA